MTKENKDMEMRQGYTETERQKSRKKQTDRYKIDEMETPKGPEKMQR